MYLDPVNGVVAAQPDQGRLMLECSTIDAETTRRVGKTLGEAGRGGFVDTPVSVCPSSLLTLLHRGRVHIQAHVC